MYKRLHNLLFIFAALFLTSCEFDQDQDPEKQNLSATNCPACNCNTQQVEYNFCGKITEICLNQIVYYYNECGLAARVNKNGSAVSCSSNESIRPGWDENFKDLYD